MPLFGSIEATTWLAAALLGLALLCFVAAHLVERRRARSGKETTHVFTVTVSGCTVEQAEQVMAERTGFDEDYGFQYRIGYARPQH